MIYFSRYIGADFIMLKRQCNESVMGTLPTLTVTFILLLYLSTLRTSFIKDYSNKSYQICWNELSQLQWITIYPTNFVGKVTGHHILQTIFEVILCIFKT